MTLYYYLKVIIRIKELIWDEFNSSHIQKHSVTTEEVESICSKKVTAWATYSNRYLVVERTIKGRLLTIVLVQKSKNTFYVVTARDASRKERGWIKND